MQAAIALPAVEDPSRQQGAEDPGLPVESTTAPQGAAERGTNLVPGDRITVTVFGQPDLSGNFQVDGTGFIDLPLIGPVMVKQLTPKECEKVIEGRLADGYLNRPVVSVSIGEVRPIYVLGDVKSPGAYAFRHGSSVLSAIAQAGGYGAEVGGTLSDFLLADERVRMLEGTRRMRAACTRGFLNATELADYLVGKGIPFREAHHITGHAVALAEKEGKGLEDLSLAELRGIDVRIDDGVYAVLDYAAAVRRRETPGGTGPRSVTRQLEDLRGWLAALGA